jgi:type IV pilus assembly protein PilV
VHLSARNLKIAKGVGMVEILVALVVLSVGMLGIAGLYVITLRSGGSAISRMQAIDLAADIADRIRANRGAGFSYATATATPGNNNCVGGATYCTPQQMANEDIFTWNNRIAQSLPGGPSGTIAVAGATTPLTYTITISWSEPGDSAPLTHTLVVQI